MRVFPVLLKHQETTSQSQLLRYAQLTTLSFRSLIISSSALKYPDDEMNASAAAAYAAADDDDRWLFVRYDLDLFQGAQDVISFPLFPDLDGSNLPKFAVKNLDQFQQTNGAGTPWRLIYNWYTALLPLDTNSTPHSVFDEKTQRKLATQPPEFWGDKNDGDSWVYDPEFDPDEVMQRIADLVGYPNDKERSAPSEDVVSVGTANIGVGAGNVDVQIKQNKTQETNPNLDPLNSNESAAGDMDEQTFLVGDTVDGTVDALNHAPIALTLAGRLNQIWDDRNPIEEEQKRFGRDDGIVWQETKWEDPFDAAFVVHIDAPWGGGKSTFIKYLSRILNPYRNSGPQPEWFKQLQDSGTDYWEQYRRPLHIVEFNAWRHQHVNPPWWTFWQAIYKTV